MQRDKTIEYCLHVAQVLSFLFLYKYASANRMSQAAKDMSNFNLVMEVISGLHANAVRRLGKTWQLVASKYHQMLEDLKNLISPVRQHAAVRIHTSLCTAFAM